MILHPPPPFNIYIDHIDSTQTPYMYSGTIMGIPMLAQLSKSDSKFYEFTIEPLEDSPQSDNPTYHVHINIETTKVAAIIRNTDIPTINQEIQHLFQQYTDPILYERRDHVINIIQYLYQQHGSIALQQPRKDIYDIYHRSRILWKNIQDIQRWTTTDHLMLKDTWKNAPSIIGIITAIEHQYIEHAYPIWNDTPISQHSYTESIRYLQRHAAPSLPCV